jgi:hypothetical protein
MTVTWARAADAAPGWQGEREVFLVTSGAPLDV